MLGAPTFVRLRDARATAGKPKSFGKSITLLRGGSCCDVTCARGRIHLDERYGSLGRRKFGHTENESVYKMHGEGPPSRTGPSGLPQPRRSAGDSAPVEDQHASTQESHEVWSECQGGSAGFAARAQEANGDGPAGHAQADDSRQTIEEGLRRVVGQRPRSRSGESPSIGCVPNGVGGSMIPVQPHA